MESDDPTAAGTGAQDGHTDTASCCAMARPRNGTKSAIPRESASGPGNSTGMVFLEGGSFLMGSTDSTFPGDGEGPVREVHLDPFWIDPYAVSNERFSEFTSKTGYCTEAEKFGWSYVFHSFLPTDHPPTRGVPSAPWWRQVFGANWLHPEGSGSDLEERSDHPVVHVSWSDAVAYANWAGQRLPSEAEWEYAARGGLEQKAYPWGDRLSPNGVHRCNIWQGTFPTKNTARDGFLGTAPIDAYQPNGYGLYNVAGNVWEWCSDWWGAAGTAGTSMNPQGPPSGDEKVTKGGSYLCHRSYCNRYRVSARTHNTPDSSSGHTGFRLVRDAGRDNGH